MIAVRKRRLPTSARYEFLDPIGQGGAGTVYRALDRFTGQTVAIKVLDTKISQNLTLHRRLAVEFQAAQVLEHPNIVRALECNTDGETSYLVYEFVAGGSLGARIDALGPVPVDESIGIITQLIQALHYAHSHNIIHRDVKPDNILILPNGRTKLTDFGLAKDHNNVSQDLTRPASALGTPHFMAPEQFADAKSVDLRSDIYSVAATLYNMLTGQLPFDAKVPIAILANKEMMRIATVRSLNPDVSEGVDTAIFAALDPIPNRRPATCMAFFKMLTARDANAATPKPAGETAAVERRRSPRFSLRLGRCALVDPCLHGGSEEQWPLIVRDVSQCGIGILLARRFEPGTELVIEGNAGPANRPERLAAHVVRVETEAAGHWVHGCTFDTPLTPVQLQTLVGMV